MTDRSDPIETSDNSDHSPAARFGRVSPNAWRVSGKTMTIDQYIEGQRQSISSTDLCLLETFTGRLLDKLKEANAAEHPGFDEAVYLLVQVLQSTSVQRTKDPLPLWLAEVGFAAGYLLKRFDLIPDHVAEIGLVDDALIVQRVIERNRPHLDHALAQENG
ncbi:MAG TPA: YkvA family protein [Chthoniobacterales bacterium]